MSKKIINFVVTGTKGKTSVATLINYLLSRNYEKLLISSEGVFFNSRKTASYKDFLVKFGFSPNVPSGRYVIYNFFRRTAIDLADG